MPNARRRIHVDIPKGYPPKAAIQAMVETAQQLRRALWTNLGDITVRVNPHSDPEAVYREFLRNSEATPIPSG